MRRRDCGWEKVRWVSIDGRLLTGWSVETMSKDEMSECGWETIDQLLGREAKGGRGRRGGGGGEKIDLEGELLDQRERGP